MNPVTKSTKKSHILYEATLLDHADDALFEPDAWRAEGGLGEAIAGRGTTFFLTRGDRHWVLRHYRRGGLAARFSRDLYLWAGLMRSRPWREWQLLAKLQTLDLPAPRPVAARVIRQGLFYRGDLITERLDATPLSARLCTGALPARTWSAIGACIRRFHMAGVFHADLNAHNILVAEDGRIFLIDFDRGDRRNPGSWCEGNLSRLARSLEKLQRQREDFHFRCDDWAALRAGYCDLNVAQMHSL